MVSELVGLEDENVAEPSRNTEYFSRSIYSQKCFYSGLNVRIPCSTKLWVIPLTIWAAVEVFYHIIIPAVQDQTERLWAAEPGILEVGGRIT